MPTLLLYLCYLIAQGVEYNLVDNGVILKHMRENKKKIENLILHFASQDMSHLGKKKLAKLLYIADFTNHELHEKDITGFSYKKLDYGPFPNDLYHYLDSMVARGDLSMVKPDSEYLPQTISALKKPDYSVFDSDEIKVIKESTDKYKTSNARTLEDMVKDEPPYKMVKYGEVIPYHLAYYRNSFDEMTLDESY